MSLNISDSSPVSSSNDASSSHLPIDLERNEQSQRERMQSVAAQTLPMPSTSSSSSPPSSLLSSVGGWFTRSISEVVDYGKKTTIAAAKNVAFKTLDAAVRKYGPHAINEKNRLIEEAKRTMLLNLRDPQFPALVEMLNLFIWTEVEKKLNEDQSEIGLILRNHKELIRAILEINLARGLANLSQIVAHNQSNIANYDHQPSLVNVFLTLCQTARPHNNMENLAGEILTSLFPDKSGSIYLGLPGYLDAFKSLPGLNDFIFDQIRAPLTDLLMSTHTALKNDPERNAVWEAELKSKMGSQVLTSLTEIPTALLLGYAKNFIQTNPKAVGSIAKMLGSQLIGPKATTSAPTSSSQPSIEKSERERQLLFAQLSQSQLAEWIIDSIRVLLHSRDGSLEGLTQFIKQAFENLTLALMAKGTQLTFSENNPASSPPASSSSSSSSSSSPSSSSSSSSSSTTASSSEEQIKEHLFFKELIDRIIHKLESNLSNGLISDEFLKDLMNDLPLPEFVKKLLHPLIKQKAGKLQKNFNLSLKADIDISKAVEDHQQSDPKTILRRHKDGEKIISILDSIADEIVEKALESNLGLITQFGLEDSIEEWMDIYLPGIKMTESLKEWFAKNVHELGIGTDGTSSQSIDRIKKTIATALQKAVSRTDAAQLFRNIHACFIRAFENYNATTKQQFMQAQTIQSQVDLLKRQIKKLTEENNQYKKEISKKAASLAPEQKTALERLKKAKSRYMRGLAAMNDLKSKRDKTLAALNEAFPDAPWTIEQMQSLLLVPHPIPEDEKRLLEMPTEQLQLLSEGLNLILTLSRIEKENAIFNNELDACEQSYASLHPQNETEQKEQSVRSLQELLLKNRDTINQLNQQIDDLNNELVGLLASFQNLSDELSALLGLSELKDLKLPQLLEDKILSIIESMKKSKIPRFLFMQVNPFAQPILDIRDNREKLQELAMENDFLNRISKILAEKLINRVPDFITSYKSIVEELLTLMGNENPSEKAIKRMVKDLQAALIQSGKRGISISALEPIVEEYLKKEMEEEEQNSASCSSSSSSSTSHVTEKSRELRRRLQHFIANPGFKQFTQEHFRDFFKKDSAAPILLSKRLNRFLLARGKANLTPHALIEIYIGSQAGKPIAEEQKRNIVEAIGERKLVQRVKDIAITPEEIIENFTDAVPVPGARGLNTLIASPLRKIIEGKDDAFKKNHEVVQQYAEGMFLRIFIKIAETARNYKNEDEDLLTAFTRKLKELIPSAVHSNPEEIAHQMIDTLIKDIIGVKGQEDFKGVPLPLQQMAYDKLKELLYQYMTPYLLTIVECAQTKKELKKVSGSDFLDELSQAISRDVVNLIPKKIKAEDVAKKVRNNLPNMDEGLHRDLLTFVQTHLSRKSDAYKNLSRCVAEWLDGIISKALLRMAKKNPAVDGKDSLMIATEKLIEIATRKYQAAHARPIAEVADELEKEVMRDVFAIESHRAFRGLPEDLQREVYNLIKGQLAGNLIRLEASRQRLKSDNPEIQKARAGLKDFDPKDYKGEACGHLLGQLVGQFLIDSLPETINEMGTENLKVVNGISKSLEISLGELARSNLSAARVLLKYTQSRQFQAMLGENLQKIADPKALKEDKKQGAELIGNLMDLILNKRLHDWSAQPDGRKSDIERKLIQSLLEVGVGHIKILNDAKEIAKKAGRTEILHADFVQAAGSKLHPAVQTAPVDFKTTIDHIMSKLALNDLPKDQVDLMRKLMCEAFARLADQEKRKTANISMKSIQDAISTIYQQTTGMTLPQEQIKSLSHTHLKSRNLKELLRWEAEKPSRKAEKAAYGPYAKLILETFLPNGPEDELLISLTPGLDKDERTKQLKLVQLSLPSAIPLIIESLFHPDMLDQIVLNTLEATRDTMNGEIVLGEEEPADRPLDGIDEISGALIAELMKTMQLPEWVKKKVAPEGVTTAAMKKSMGAAMRRQFSGKFIDEMIPKALLSATKKDKTGKTALDFRPKAEKEAEMPQKRVQMQADLKRLSREVVDSSISNYIRTQWAVFQKRFDGVIEKLFGNLIGINTKRLLDAIFRFIFFKLIGTALSVLLSPATKRIKEAIYRLTSLDENRDLMLGLLKNAPVDQPPADYVVYNQDLAFKLVEAIQTAFKKSP